MLIHCLNDKPYDTYGIETVKAAVARGHTARMFSLAEHVTEAGYVFARLHQWAPRIWKEREELAVLQADPKFKFIQDRAQIELYESKIGQTLRWGDWMPRTRILNTEQDAFDAAHSIEFPIISKASIGSASHNVRLLKTVEDAVREAYLAFHGGIKIVGGVQPQRGYVYWQSFIPHTETWRVAAVGTKRHVYKRFNFDDRPMAAPSKVKPTQPVPMCDEVESLLAFSNAFFEHAKTSWCAIDVLKTPEGEWRLLETSLAWARGNDAAGNAPFYGTKHNLLTQHALLIEEMEAGVFG